MPSHYRHQQNHYHEPSGIDWTDIIPGLIVFGAVVVVIISYFIFDTEKKAELANAEATKNYEKIISIAVKNCDLEVVEFLIGKSLIDIHSTLGLGERLLGYAAEKECLEGIQFLVEQKVDINSTSVIELDKRTVLHYAAEQGNLEIVKFLLQNGANPNTEEFRGRKPRDLAAMQYSENSNKPYKKIINLLHDAEKHYKAEK